MSRRSQAQYVPPDGGIFRSDVVLEGRTASVRASGELDMAAVPDLSAAVAQAREGGYRQVVFDLRELNFMDSCGLRFLLECHAESRQDGFTIAVIPGPPAVQRLFELTGTVDHLPFIDP